MRHALGGVGFSVLLFVGCYGDVEPSYSGALGYWTAEARARATTWHCERLADGGRACNGVVADTAYFVHSHPGGLVLEVRKRWRVPPGRVLRHLALLEVGFDHGPPAYLCGTGRDRRQVWRLHSHFAELSPAVDSAGYMLIADTARYSRHATDTLCPAP